MLVLAIGRRFAAEESVKESGIGEPALTGISEIRGTTVRSDCGGNWRRRRRATGWR